MINIITNDDDDETKNKTVKNIKNKMVIKDILKNKNYNKSYCNNYKKKIISSALKQKVWDLNYKRTIGFCKCCDVNIVTLNTCHFSHILAEKNGGMTNLMNLTVCCSNCNLSMGTMHLEEFKNKNGFNNKELTNDLRKQSLLFLNEEHNKLIN